MKLAIKVIQQLWRKKLKVIIRMLKKQRSNIERNKFIKDTKRIGIDEIIKQNERINNNLKFQV